MTSDELIEIEQRLQALSAEFGIERSNNDFRLVACTENCLCSLLQLDFQNRPHSRDKSRGRFLIRADKFMDPEIYKKDRKLTVGGRVAGDSEQPLGDHMYRYPVIEVEDLTLLLPVFGHPELLFFACSANQPEL